ncbi:MAG: tetratricopeptide repeat protein [Pseudomonadota bacterium]
MISKTDPRQHAALLGQALQHRQSGNLKAAKAAYSDILKRDPDNAEALHLLGCLLDEMGSTGEGVKMLLRAVKSNPNVSVCQFNLANMLFKLGNQQGAIRHFREAIGCKPDYAAAHNNLGYVLSLTGQRAEARACFESAIRCRPGYADPHHNLGIELKAGADFEGAVAAFQEAIRIKPGFADAHCNLGSAYLQMQRIADALREFQTAAQLQPANAKFQTNLGAAALRLGRQQDAAAYFERALQLHPSDAFTRSNLILASSYFTPEASKLYALCVAWDQIHAAGLRRDNPRHGNVRDPDRRLRVGYVSADFRNHVAAYWIEPLLAGSQHTDFEVFCYCNSPISDEVTDRLRSHADVWVECAALTDDALADRIRRDGIDILVDLSSHTEGHRLLVFARQPAPVQVSWFGLPVSTGLQAMHYRITDAVMDPPGVGDGFYSETLVRLDRFYAAFRPNPKALPVGAGPASRGKGVTFASINTFAKITRPMLELWATVLAGVPDARLLLQAAGLDSAELGMSVQQVFAQQGISPDRLLLRGWTGMEEFMHLGEEVDIVLDPFPFNGGVTTCHALWMGLPVVTLTGETAASRVGASILGQIGLQDLIATDVDAYRTIAVGLANDLERLAALRASLRERMVSGGVLDGADLAGQTEAAFRTMWRTWCAA